MNNYDAFNPPIQVDEVELIELARKEWEALQEHATREELNRIFHVELDGGSLMWCIYGAMTGHCCSPRALHLMELCAPTFLSFEYTREDEKQIRPKGEFTSPVNFSPLEALIRQCNSEGYQAFADITGQPFHALVDAWTPYNDDPFQKEFKLFVPNESASKN